MVSITYHQKEPQIILREDPTTMLYYLLKIVVTAVLVVLISEIAKRSSVIGAILASVPLTSVLAMLWLYVETGDVNKVSALGASIFWLVIPSLALFAALPRLLDRGYNFYVSLALSIGLTAVSYFAMLSILNRVGIEL
jgi:hypothetical protein